MNKYVSLKKYIETITKFWIKNIFEMPKLKKNNNQIQVFENKFWITFSCENLYWTNFKLLNKKYFWNVKIEKKNNNHIQMFEKKFGIKFSCENLYWTNFKLLNKKYFWNAKIEKKYQSYSSVWKIFLDQIQLWKIWLFQI